MFDSIKNAIFSIDWNSLWFSLSDLKFKMEEKSFLLFGEIIIAVSWTSANQLVRKRILDSHYIFVLENSNKNSS